MWGYNESALHYTPMPPTVPDPVVIYDLLHVLRFDTLIKADTSLYDLIYVYKTVRETVLFVDDMKIE